MQDCELLYLSDRPENLVLRNIAVPPLALRPSVFVDGGTQRLSHTSVYLYPLLFSLLLVFLFRITSIVCLFSSLFGGASDVHNCFTFDGTGGCFSIMVNIFLYLVAAMKVTSQRG